MVEFGLKLQDNKVSKWADKYLNYERLKTLLKKAKSAQKVRLCCYCVVIVLLLCCYCVVIVLLLLWLLYMILVSGYSNMYIRVIISLSICLSISL